MTTRTNKSTTLARCVSAAMGIMTDDLGMPASAIIDRAVTAYLLSYPMPEATAVKVRAALSGGTAPQEASATV